MSVDLMSLGKGRQEDVIKGQTWWYTRFFDVIKFQMDGVEWMEENDFHYF